MSSRGCPPPGPGRCRLAIAPFPDGGFATGRHFRLFLFFPPKWCPRNPGCLTFRSHAASFSDGTKVCKTRTDGHLSLAQSQSQLFEVLVAVASVSSRHTQDILSFLGHLFHRLNPDNDGFGIEFLGLLRVTHQRRGFVKKDNHPEL